MQAGWTGDDSSILRQLLSPAPHDTASQRFIHSPILIVQNKDDLLQGRNAHDISGRQIHGAALASQGQTSQTPAQVQVNLPGQLVWSSAELQGMLPQPPESGNSSRPVGFQQSGMQGSSQLPNVSASTQQSQPDHHQQLNAQQPSHILHDTSCASPMRVAGPETSASSFPESRLIRTSAAKGTGLQGLKAAIAQAAGCGQVAPGEICDWWIK